MISDFIAIFFLANFCVLSTSSFLDTHPQQVHLALAGADTDGDSNGMTVSWFTQDSTQTSVVEYGFDPKKLDKTAQASSPAIQYLEKYGYHHHVTLKNLNANTMYYYRVGDSSSKDWSKTFKFRSAPKSVSASFAISVFGDLGYLGSKERPMEIAVEGLVSNWSAVGTREQIEKLNNAQEIDFVWHLGDIAYVDDAYAHHVVTFGYEETYNGYMQWFENITSTIPYMVTVGNHETECHSPTCVVEPSHSHSLKNFTAYNTRWHMPSESSGGVLNMWYSFNYGPVHFISLNTETDFPGAAEENHGALYESGHFGRDGEYLAWLEEDLKKAADERNAGLRPWIVVGGHRPYAEIKKQVEELFNKYGVDLYLCGHVHSYRRSVPAFQGIVDSASIVSPTHYHNAQSVVCIVVGGAGCDEMHFVASQESLPGDVTTNKMASGVLEVHNSSTLHWKLIQSYGGKILDELWITKSVIPKV